jgi:hypothetical protein
MDTTLKTLGALQFNTKLARKLQGLKNACGATAVRQNYRGTGAQAYRRQLWVRLPEFTIDIWLEAKGVDLGGVTQTRLNGLRYETDEVTVEQVYNRIVEALQNAQKGVAARAA